MDVYCGSRSSRPANLFAPELLDGLQGGRLRSSRLREDSVGFSLDRLVTTFMKNPG